MAVRLHEVNGGQAWKVRGLPETPGKHGMAARVTLEFWLGDEKLLPGTLSFDPAFARQLAQHLIEMADHSEGI